jgi:hypothetical protein
MTTTSEALDKLTNAIRILGNSLADIFQFEKALTKFSEYFPDSLECPTCHGTKTVEIHETVLSNGKKTDRIFEDTCEDCNGTGQVTEYTKSVYEI